MTVRTKRHRIFDRILPALGEPNDMMTFQIGLAIFIIKGRGLTSELANAMCSLFRILGDKRIADVGIRND